MSTRDLTSSITGSAIRHSRTFDRPGRCGLPVALARLQSRLRRRQSRDRHAERRAADVVQTHLMAELDRARLTAVLAANPHLQVRARLPPPLGPNLDQLPYPFTVEHLERILLQDL